MPSSLPLEAPAVTTEVGSLADPRSPRLRDLSPQQWKSGIAAWLGWTFDGLELHLYTIVATPFVAQLLATDKSDPQTGYTASIIQASFLVGWAVGGGFFGRIGDRVGRARALMLTIFTYAVFTGLSFFVDNWWQLLICRFLAALGIGGEWAVGAALLAETWPKRWRPWIAATLQSGVNCGILMAMAMAFLLSLVDFAPYYQYRCVFLVGVLPAFLVLWIRRAVSEPEEWQAARGQSRELPRVVDLFRGDVLKTTVLSILVCGFSLSAHWAFMFWFIQHLQVLPEFVEAQWTSQEITRLITVAMVLVMVTSIMGNYLAGWFSRMIGYRKTISAMCLVYFFALLGTYGVSWGSKGLFLGMAVIGVCQGLFGLFTMYLPPLFPTLLRTTGAGFCYNIGRIAAAVGTVFFGLFNKVDDHSYALFYSAFLFLPAAVVVMFLTEPPDEQQD